MIWVTPPGYVQSTVRPVGVATRRLPSMSRVSELGADLIRLGSAQAGELGEHERRAAGQAGTPDSGTAHAAAFPL